MLQYLYLNSKIDKMTAQSMKSLLMPKIFFESCVEVSIKTELLLNGIIETKIFPRKHYFENVFQEKSGYTILSFFLNKTESKTRYNMESP